MVNSELNLLAESLEADLFRVHGPLLEGDPLCKALGYKSSAALRQAVCRGTVPVPVFPIQNRRGKYALVKDVAQWLAQQRLSNSTHKKERLNHEQ